MSERGNNSLLVAAVLGVLFTLVNLANLIFLEGDAARNLIAMAIGIIWTVAAYAGIAAGKGWSGDA